MEEKRIRNGICAELLSAAITYPLNTIKTNAQVNRTLPRCNLYKGFYWCILSEFINSFIFYTVFEKYKDQPPLVRSSIGSVLGITASYPFNTRRKLTQIGKSININNNYKGLNVALFNGVPGVTINFTFSFANSSTTVA
jgi:hypothetical protein